MGYRSDVCIGCREKAYQMFMDALKEVKAEPDYDLLHYDHEGNPIHYIGWEWIKWYEDVNEFRDVTAVMKTMEQLDRKSYSADYAYQYLRLGEDCGDIDQKDNGHYLGVSLIYKIDTPVCMKE